MSKTIDEREAFALALREYGAQCNVCADASKMDAARDRVLSLYDSASGEQPALTKKQRKAIQYMIEWLEKSASNLYVFIAVSELRTLLADTEVK